MAMYRMCWREQVTTEFRVSADSPEDAMSKLTAALDLSEGDYASVDEEDVEYTDSTWEFVEAKYRTEE